MVLLRKYKRNKSNLEEDETDDLTYYSKMESFIKYFVVSDISFH